MKGNKSTWKPPALAFALLFCCQRGDAVGILGWKNGKLFNASIGGVTGEIANNVSTAGYAGTSLVGDTNPSLAPDGIKVAYVGTDGNLWLAFTDGRTSLQVSKDSGPGRAERLQILFSGWAPDSKTLIFHQERIYGHPPDAPYIYEGFELYDLESGILRPLPDLKGFSFWGNNPNLITFEKDGSLFHFHLSDSHVERITSVPEDANQITASRDGKRFSFSILRYKPESSRMAILRDGGAPRAVTPWGHFTEYQRPAFSSNGHFLAFIRYPIRNDQETQEWLVRDTRWWHIFNRVRSARLHARIRPPLHWLDDYHIGTFCHDGKIQILDIRTMVFSSIEIPS